VSLFGDKTAGQAYRVLCQNTKCRATLGTIHIPCAGGRVVFACYACGSVSAFTNGPYELEAKLVGSIPVEEMKKALSRARSVPLAGA